MHKETICCSDLHDRYVVIGNESGVVLQPLLLCNSPLLVLRASLPVLTDVPQLIIQILCMHKVRIQLLYVIILI